MDSQIADLGGTLRVSQAELAVATTGQVDSESSPNLKAQQHTRVSHEYGQSRKKCCAEQKDSKFKFPTIAEIRGKLHSHDGRAERVPHRLPDFGFC